MADPEQASFDFGTQPPRVRAATPADRKAITYAIGRAFFDDPIATYLFPDEAARIAGFGAFAQLAIDQFTGAGSTYVCDPVRGAAIWQAPSPPGLGFWRQVSLALRLLRITRRRYGRAIQLSETLDEHHLPQPHWYLALLGVDPDHQGRGLGSALLAPALGQCDRERATAYLECSKESNIAFYHRHGFEVASEIRIPDGPTMWTMIRLPA